MLHSSSILSKYRVSAIFSIMHEKERYFMVYCSHVSQQFSASILLLGVVRLASPNALHSSSILSKYRVSEIFSIMHEKERYFMVYCSHVFSSCHS